MIHPCRELLQLKVEDESEPQQQEECFYDTREEISPIASNSRQICSPLDHQLYTLWNEPLSTSSVQERRNRFKRCMGLSFSSNSSPRLDSINNGTGVENGESVGNISTQGRSNSSGSELVGSSNSEIGHSTTTSFSSEHSDSENVGASSRSDFYSFKNLDDDSVFIADELQEDVGVENVFEDGKNDMITTHEFQRNVSTLPFFYRFMKREENSSVSSTSSEETLTKIRRKTKSGPKWLKKFSGVTCMAADRKDDTNVSSLYTDYCHGDYKFRMKVHSYKKRYKEFSAVYTNQEIQAHDGNILTMKFSHDGGYLATGGEDGIIRVWQIMERDRIDDDLPQRDPSCIFFNADDNFELTPIFMNKSSSIRLTSDSSCVVIPPKLFGISERPLYEYCGHTGEILDLAWSKNKSILSSSADDTVRLWEFGCKTWKKLYPHNNVVTCLQFNPVEEKSFITGCIDGKVRIWHTYDAHVVDWLDTKDIVTAVCYGPDGNHIVVGLITGNCRFYTLIDNLFELSHQLPIHRKKKSTGKMITGFQFSPNSSERLLVTCADSRVRILDKFNVICKCTGLQNSRSRISASFTKDGKHVISASEDSNVYIWNNKLDVRVTNNVQRNSSCERFHSRNASVAIPWNGFSEIYKSCHSPSNSTALNQDLLAQVPLRGTATWPEEKLQASAVLGGTSFASNAEKKLFKSSYDAKLTSSHAWGQVIVTGSLDGRIRSFQNYGLPSLF